MLYSVFAYIKFLIKSTNQHGVHSPFVFDLITNCFYDKANYKDYVKLVNYRKQLLRNNQSITITDLGTGSRIAKTNIRRIASIARHSGTTLKRAKLLYRLSKYFQYNSVLELGTSLGIATHALQLGSPNAKITSIEGCPNVSAFAKTNFKENKFDIIDAITGEFSDILKNLTPKPYDLIFFDGNHNKEATLQYFERVLPMAHNESMFIFDDIYWSKEMTEAWESIKKHPKVKVTIDTFYWGIVFFRKEQNKEHFTIRV